jgi:hypothetical protein
MLMETNTDKPFQPKSWIGLWIKVFIPLNIFFRLLHAAFPNADIPEGWPISEGRFSLPTGTGILFALLAIGSYFVYRSKKGSLKTFGLLGVLALAFFGLNLAHGVRSSMVAVNASDSIETEYYQDAARYRSVGEVLRNYNRDQTTLGMHSASHPPLPVAVSVAAKQLFGDQPEVIAIVLGTIIFACYFLLLSEASDSSRFLLSTWLALLTYSMFTFDGIIALITLVIAKGLMDKRYWVLAFIPVGLMFNFGFIIPVLGLLTWQAVARKNLLTAIIAAVWTAAFLILINFGTGYNFWEGFRTASRIENADGFRLFVDPISFICTRLENVAEILWFGGPVGLWLVSTIRHWPAENRKLITIVFSIMMLAFLTGAYHTGETARACLFVIPIFSLAALEWIKKLPEENIRQAAQTQLGFAVLVGVLMNFFW